VPARASFDYAVVRVVPRVDREEFVNAGVILFCRTRRFLGARIGLDGARLRALDAGVDLEEVDRALGAIPRICQGEGPIGKLSLAERFHWLVAPRSTLVQMSSVHSGLCEDPRRELDHLSSVMTS
jgi:hypothetical protein